MTHFATRERQGLCDTFERCGPDAPTLCPPWRTRDLAAHLVVRERRPDVSAAIWLPALTGRLEKVQNGYAAWDWPRLIHEVRTGPPAWSPMALGPVNEALNTAEFFVHHEDVLRAGPDWTVRELPGDLESALWRVATKVGRLHFARAAVGVELVASGHDRRRVHPATELGTVVVTGPPSELLLYAFGRSSVARVEVTGSQEALLAL